jgi:preprotein translocase subunit SecA
MRLPVPGAIWGDRPERVDPASGPGRPGRAPLRHGLDADPARLAAHALAAASRCAPAGAGEASRRAVEAVAVALARDGLASAAVGDALALCAATMTRALGITPRRNQLHTAAALLDQRLVELPTGEGKTCAAALAAAVAALAGAPVHVLTANVYLAERDAREMAPFYAALGLRVAAALEADPPSVRARAWRADITYASARTLGFDYLRDRLALAAADDVRSEGGGGGPLLRGLCVAIVDEADAILLDEARMPLVLAEQRADPSLRARLWQSLELAGRLEPGRDLTVAAGGREVGLTDAGRARLADAAPDYGGAWLNAVHREDLVGQALFALHGLRRDRDYIVREREVVLVDRESGRAAPGRQWSRALHSLVALKERLPLPPDAETRASLTYPRLFARYVHLAGLSATLAEADSELRQAYGLRVEIVAAHRPSRRRRAATRLFATRRAQVDAAVARAIALSRTGRPVLVATDTVAESAEVSARLAGRGIAHEVLDARQDQDEAGRIAGAGRAGAITVTTQMAGRGTDIRLDEAARKAGGLHVLSLQHNRSGRVDRQLAGRAGRQGDPGSVEAWLRLDASPLTEALLPMPLGALRSMLARRTRRRDGAGIGAGAALWLAVVRRYWAWEDADLRRQTLERDRRWSRRLHFASIAE